MRAPRDRLSNGRISLRAEANEQRLSLLEHGPLDHGRLLNHELDSPRFRQTGFRGFRKLSKRGAGAVEQHLPADGLGPFPEGRPIDAGNLVVVKLMIEQPSMIKRPVLEKGRTLLVGFDEERYSEIR